MVGHSLDHLLCLGAASLLVPQVGPGMVMKLVLQQGL